jgi:hypothetical protein
LRSHMYAYCSAVRDEYGETNLGIFWDMGRG